MSKVLSIVVPAYNVEQYLDKCLSSLKNVNVLNDIEVLVINDGSKDKTAQIAEKYVEQYPNTYKLYNKENGGHGSGINYGIRYAQGKYFKVLDGDDWLNEKELECFVNLLKELDVDLVASDFMCIQDETYKILQEKKSTEDKRQYGKIVSLKNGEVKQVIKMHSLTIKTEILLKQKVEILEKCFYVDCEYILYPIPGVDTVYFDDRYLYMYRLGRDGQSMNIKNMQKNIGQHIKVLNKLLEFYCNVETDVETKKYLANGIAQIVEDRFQIYISMGLKKNVMKELREFDKNLLMECPDVYYATNKKSISMLRKTNYLILPIGAIVYKFVK